MFTEKQTERYSRHIILNEFGPRGQSRLLKSKVLVVGAGGLGSPALLYLAAAGIGTIGIADFDSVEVSNLQRQVIHSEADIGSRKTDSACRAIKRLNSDIDVILHHEEINFSNARRIMSAYDFVVDGTDRLSTKFLLNDACVLCKKPFSHAGAVEFGGQIMTVIPGKTACLRCVLPTSLPSDHQTVCSESGVLNAMVGVLGTLQALEAIKFIAQTGILLANAIMFFDGRSMNFKKVSINKNPACPICGNNPSIKGLGKDASPRCKAI